MAKATGTLIIRAIHKDDSLEELTELLHRAYKPLADMGLRFFATHQTVEQTQSRVESGKCFVAELDGKLIGTIALYTEPKHDDAPDWYHRPDVGWFGQFGIEPTLQGKGIGKQMIDFIEERAVELGLSELALDTSEKAEHLIQWYKRLGWRIVEETDWSVTNYRSLVMSKTLTINQ